MSHYEIEVPWLDGGGLDTTNCAVVGLPGPTDPPGFVVHHRGTYEECDAWIEAAASQPAQTPAKQSGMNDQ